MEASGSQLVDELERSNPLEAKRRVGLTKKIDRLDAKGLAILLRNGTLQEVWIPPSELLRLRISLVRLRTRGKNRIHDRRARYNVQIPGADLFGTEARTQLKTRLAELAGTAVKPSNRN